MTLVLSQGSALNGTGTWTNLHDDELRRRAVTAARDRDEATLISLTRTYLTLNSASGVRTSKNTLDAYTRGVRRYLTYTGEQAVNLLHPGRHDPSRYVQFLQAEGLTPAGVRLRVSAASCLYRALRWAGATEADPFRDVRLPRDTTSGIEKRPPYTEEDLVEVLHHADLHETFLLFLVAHAGLRIAEALNLRWEDIDETRRVLIVRSGKGGKMRRVAMSVRLARAARHFRALYEPGGPEHSRYRPRGREPEFVFRYGTRQTAYTHLEAAFQRAGVEFRGFHPGRKYAGTRLIAQIKDFGRVAAHLGHESVDTTRKGYAQLPADDLKGEVAGW